MNAKIPYEVQFAPKYLGNYIGGEFHPAVEPNGEWDVKSPAATHDLVARIKYSYQDVDSAIQSAKSAFKSWKKLPASERFVYLRKYRDALKARENTIVETISREVGKPLWESKTEFQAMLNKVDITIEDSMKLIAPLRIDNVLPGVVGKSEYRPHGVMAVIGPFNFPGHLPNGHIVPALVTGNTVVFKPSEKTPMTGQLIAEAMHEAGLPSGVFNLVQGERETSRRLCVHEGVNGILFTGSYEVGTRIKQDTLLQHWKLLALEMGGKNSSIVWEDADLDSAVYEVLTSAFLTTGQRCSATSRAIVHESLMERFLEKLHAASKAFKIGHPFENAFMGPVIDSSTVDRFLKFQPIATRDGFEILMRGKVLELPYAGHYVTPAIAFMHNADPAHARKSVYQQTELFAPNLAVQGVTDLDQAIALANITQYGLVTSVFTKSTEVYEKCSEDLECGLINLNRGTVGASSRLPFGGLKKSGNHQPTALSSVFYCAYPVASLECAPESPGLKAPLTGLDWK
ncbi:MAG: aldehyde dehydrogenase family protein [Proteobacteria bacterium]|nr:MAG: aldehyde dehydrogenase family protein [Pseudomonadota bacterium]